jgi:hypothetical protein
MDFAVFAHNPDGDIGYGQVIGRFRTSGAAQAKADAVNRAGKREGLTVEAFVVEMVRTSTSAADVAREVQ